MSQTFLDFPQDPCKSGASKDVAAGLVALAKYLTGSDGQGVIKQLTGVDINQLISNLAGQTNGAGSASPGTTEVAAKS